VRRGPTPFKRRSKSWLEAYLGILETNTVFLRELCIAGGIRVEINRSEPNDLCDLITDYGIRAVCEATYSLLLRPSGA
jgi:hypothetical protein